MRTAIYARVSTTDKGQDVDLQLNELREFVLKRGWKALEYVDQGISGAKAKRPASVHITFDNPFGVPKTP